MIATLRGFDETQFKMAKSYLEAMFEGCEVENGDLKKPATPTEQRGDLHIQSVLARFVHEATEFRAKAHQYGLHPRHLHATFGKFQIVGLRTRNVKYPILVVTTKSGVVYKMSAERVRERLIREGTF